METLRSAQFGTDFATWDPRAILRSHDLSTKTQDGLVHVYKLILATAVASSVGATFFTVTHFPLFLSTLISIALSLVITLSYPGGSEGGRVFMLLGFGFFQGSGLGSLIQMANFINPSLVPMAVALTAIVFGCLTAAATFSPRRSYLFLAGGLSSMLSWLFFASMLNLFFGSLIIFELQIWGGLAVFFGFVLFDTQLIIEKLEHDDRDYVKHALDLYVDMVAIFIRILVILLKMQDSSEKKKRNRR